MPFPSLARLAAVLACAVTPLACGDEDDDAPARAPQTPAVHLDLAEVQSLLDEHVAVIRTGGEASVASVAEPEAVTTVRLAAQTGEEFDLVVFPAPGDARTHEAALARAAGEDEPGAAIRAANVVAVFDQRPRDGAAAVAWDVLRRLGDACADPEDAAPRLRGLCLDPDPPRPDPPGRGTAADRGADPGSQVRVGPLRYDVVLARALNPAIRPDRAWVGRHRPAPGHVLLGVLLRACNPDDEPHRATEELTVVAAFGRRVTPEPLPASTAVAYDGGRVPADRCVPREGSVAEATAGGALVLFEVREDLLQERPLALEIRDAGEVRRLQLDL
ncbi:MAG TPA: hypothetical protein VD931_20805 [Baekduia sp.]|nr:hypothetical protein [Baekduia sp.]